MDQRNSVQILKTHVKFSLHALQLNFKSYKKFQKNFSVLVWAKCNWEKEPVKAYNNAFIYNGKNFINKIHEPMKYAKLYVTCGLFCQTHPVWIFKGEHEIFNFIDDFQKQSMGSFRNAIVWWLLLGDPIQLGSEFLSLNFVYSLEQFLKRSGDHEALLGDPKKWYFSISSQFLNSFTKSFSQSTNTLRRQHS